MGRLADIAGASVLTGEVAFTDKGGFTRTFEDEGAAIAVIGSKTVFHHRGAFYEEGCTPWGYTPPKAEAKPSSSSGRRRKPKETDASE